MKEMYLAGLYKAQMSLKSEVSSITQEESLIAPGVTGNCINWQAGHILVVRQHLLKQFGIDPFLTPEESSLYESGSSPISANTASVNIEKLWKGLESTYTELENAVHSINEEALDQIVDSKGIPNPPPNFTLAKLLIVLIYHEGLHIGQIYLTKKLIDHNK